VYVTGSEVERHGQGRGEGGRGVIVEVVMWGL